MITRKVAALRLFVVRAILVWKRFIPIDKPLELEVPVDYTARDLLRLSALAIL